MFVIATVTNWESPRDSRGRVPTGERLIGREILLNTNRISDLVQKGSGCKFYFTDNLANPRDGRGYVEVEDHIETIVGAIATDYPTEYTVLPVYVNNDPSRNTVIRVILTSSIAFADRYNPVPTRSWVYYVEGGSKFQRVLVNRSIEAIGGIGLLRDFDGNTYRSVIIGAQEWTVQNLRTTHYADGTAIPNIIDNTAWLADTDGAYCYYNFNASNGDIYGALYNWYAVDNANVLAYFTRGGIVEAGWRVPTVNDWDVLVAEIGTDNDAGGLLKEIGYAHWANPNTGAEDAYGFRARGNGNRFVDSDDLPTNGFDSLRVFNDSWTSEDSGTSGLSIYLSTHWDDFSDWSHEKFGGMAVRCMRDVV